MTVVKKKNKKHKTFASYFSSQDTHTKLVPSLTIHGNGIVHEERKIS